MHMLQLEKKKQKQTNKQKCGVQEEFYGKNIGEYIYVCVCVFWNYDNRFWVGVGFKFLKLRW